ncbi:MAG: c-type cytochrome [Thiohalobacteraceae bacterium]
MHRLLSAITCSALALFTAGLSAQTDVEALVTQGNDRGAIACATCHQADGAGQAQAGFPRLAGMDSDHFMDQLQSYRDGTRNNPVMAPIAKALSEEEGRALAEYYEKQQAPAGASSDLAPEVRVVGERLAQSGDWQGRELPACVQCHGPNGEGVGSAFPALAGQHASYIQSQIEAWKRGERSNDPLGLMKVVADKLSAEETQAVAAYFAQLGAAAETSGTSAAESPGSQP